MLDLSLISRYIEKAYNPPIRGLTAKKRRQRKKAERRLAGTIRGMTNRPNSLLKLLGPQESDGWSVPIFFGKSRSV